MRRFLLVAQVLKWAGGLIFFYVPNISSTPLCGTGSGMAGGLIFFLRTDYIHRGDVNETWFLTCNLLLV